MNLIDSSNGIEISQLDVFFTKAGDIIRRFSQNYNVYGPEDTKASLKNAEINLDRVLSEEITIFTTENNPVTNTLGGWLRNPKVTNPFDAKYKTPLHPKGVAGALAVPRVPLALARGAAPLRREGLTHGSAPRICGAAR